MGHACKIWCKSAGKQKSFSDPVFSPGRQASHAAGCRVPAAGKLASRPYAALSGSTGRKNSKWSDRAENWYAVPLWTRWHAREIWWRSDEKQKSFSLRDFFRGRRARHGKGSHRARRLSRPRGRARLPACSGVPASQNLELLRSGPNSVDTWGPARGAGSRGFEVLLNPEAEPRAMGRRRAGTSRRQKGSDWGPLDIFNMAPIKKFSS